MRKIKRGDTVYVTTGKCKGQTGEVLKVKLDKQGQGKAIVKGVNLCTKFVKKQGNQQGFTTKFERGVDYSNLLVMHKKKPCKVGFEIVNGMKQRIFKETRIKL